MRNHVGFKLIKCLKNCAFEIKCGVIVYNIYFKKDGVYSYNETPVDFFDLNKGFVMTIYSENGHKGICRITKEFFEDNFLSPEDVFYQVNSMFEKLMDEE